jgi:uncharacterized sulfatase
MLKKLIIGFLMFMIIGTSLLWINRIEVLLFISSLQHKVPVAEHREVIWESGPSQFSDKPNIVLILTDDMGINDVSTFGGGMIQTPNIDKLAARGALFTKGYAAHANCAPSRAAMLTGRDASRTGFDATPLPDRMGRVIALVANEELRGRPPAEYFAEVDRANPSFRERGLDTEEITVAEVLKDVGYRTLHVGKWHLGRTDDKIANAQGFDESITMASGLFLPVDHPQVVNAKVDYSGLDRFIWENMDYAVQYNNSDRFAPDGYLSDYFTNQAVRAIEANANRPFFLYLAHWGPHNPLQATKSDFDAVGDIQPHRKRVYAAMLLSLDRSVARVMATLEEQGIADNTIVIFSSDNGGADYVAIDDLNKPYRGWKNTFFEGGIRVPFSITWPKVIPANTVIDTPVNLYDLMPTIAKTGQATLPQDRVINGRDLSPLWNGETSVGREDNAMYWFTGNYQVVQADGWKLQLNPNSAQIFLFNLNEDPTEQSNLAASEPEQLSKLMALIDTYFKNAVPRTGFSVISAPVSIDKHLGQEMLEGDTYIMWNN